jgi:hypothetical protein
MDAALHAIEGGGERKDVAPSTFDDFRLGEPTQVSSLIAVETPGWTPYCLDCTTRTALFVELSPEVDLSQAVFAHVLQWREARRALVVPFAALEQMAAAVVPPSRVVFVHNIGRCGSTLMNAMLNGVDGVWSLSEPDVYFELVTRRDLLDPAEIPALIRASTRLLFRPPVGKVPHTLGIKFRAESIYQAERFQAAWPEAASIFSYREGVGWARSFHYFMRNLGVPPMLDDELRRFVWPLMTGGADIATLAPYADLAADGIYPEELLAPAWAFYMEEYLRQWAAGVPFLAIRYDELDGDRQGTAARLLAHCGLPAKSLAGATLAFGHDSQAGTAIARDRRDASFTEVNAARFRATLALHPRPLSPDQLLPDVFSDPRSA